MKKIVLIIAIALVLVGCTSPTSDEKTIIVGASITPHAQILEFVKEDVEAKGYTLEIKEFTDYVLPNEALEKGDLDANYFQHLPYLENFNEERKTHLVSAGVIHYEPFGIYSSKLTDLTNLAEKAKVLVPNDGTNEARALLLLEAAKLIELDKGAGLDATVRDITSNPLQLEIIEIDAAQLTRSLQDVDLAVINGNYALQDGLSVSDDALLIEDEASFGALTYGNVIAVHEDNLDSEKTKVLIEVLSSEKVAEFIQNEYDGAVVPLLP